MAVSKTQIKRQKYDYRYHYFKQNPGLFGKIWFCSQCHKILWGKKNVQVDHIWALGAGGVNRTINTVAICRKCNSRKSDKMGLWLLNGLLGKCLELVIFRTRDVINFILSFFINLLKLLLSTFGRLTYIVIVLGILYVIWGLFVN